MTTTAVMRMPRDRDIVALADSELPAYFTKEEIDRILAQVKGRDRLFLSLLWQTGVRVSETLAIEVKDVDFHAKVLRVRSLKKLKPETRCVPINGYLIGDLVSYIAQEGLRGVTIDSFQSHARGHFK